MYKLRELNKADIPTINKWRNDHELISFLGAPFRYINLDVDYKWYDDYLNNRHNTLRCSIVEKANTDEVLGLISLTNINTINRSAVLHIMIGNKENQGKGIGSFAVNKVLRHAFENINLNRIELSVLENNRRAIKLYEKHGFKKEGIKKEATYKDGKFLNMVIMGILSADFKI